MTALAWIGASTAVSSIAAVAAILAYSYSLHTMAVIPNGLDVTTGEVLVRGHADPGNLWRQHNLRLTALGVGFCFVTFATSVWMIFRGLKI